MKIQKYTEKPKEITAVQFDGSTESVSEIKRLTKCDVVLQSPRFGETTLTLKKEGRGSSEEDPRPVEEPRTVTVYLSQYVALSNWPDEFDIYVADEFHEKWETKEEL